MSEVDKERGIMMINIELKPCYKTVTDILTDEQKLKLFDMLLNYGFSETDVKDIPSSYTAGKVNDQTVFVAYQMILNDNL